MLGEAELAVGVGVGGGEAVDGFALGREVSIVHVSGRRYRGELPSCALARPS